MRCRTAFTFTNRKHHCRNCGLVFDQACSSKSLPLPHFGITTPVRVCDSCFAKGNKLSAANGGGPAPAVPSGRTLRSKEDFDADLQRAIELSLAESRQNGSSSAIYGSEPPLARNKQTAEDDDEELRLAIEASLREMDKARPSAPNGFDEPEFRVSPGIPATERFPRGGLVWRVSNASVVRCSDGLASPHFRPRSKRGGNHLDILQYPRSDGRVRRAGS